MALEEGLPRLTEVGVVESPARQGCRWLSAPASLPGYRLSRSWSYSLVQKPLPPGPARKPRQRWQLRSRRGPPRGRCATLRTPYARGGMHVHTQQTGRGRARPRRPIRWLRPLGVAGVVVAVAAVAEELSCEELSPRERREQWLR